MSGTSKNKSTDVEVTATCSKRIKVLESLPAATQIKFRGKTYTIVQAIAIYQGCLDGRTALTVVRAQEKKALTTSRAADKAYLAFDAGVKAWATTEFDPESEIAAEFDVAPKPKATPTVETKALAQQKAKATREARGTVGPKKRLRIKGVLPVTTPPEEDPKNKNKTV